MRFRWLFEQVKHVFFGHALELNVFEENLHHSHVKHSTKMNKESKIALRAIFNMWNREGGPLGHVFTFCNVFELYACAETNKTALTLLNRSDLPWKLAAKQMEAWLTNTIRIKGNLNNPNLVSFRQCLVDKKCTISVCLDYNFCVDCWVYVPTYIPTLTGQKDEFKTTNLLMSCQDELKTRHCPACLFRKSLQHLKTARQICRIFYVWLCSPRTLRQLETPPVERLVYVRDGWSKITRPPSTLIVWKDECDQWIQQQCGGENSLHWHVQRAWHESRSILETSRLNRPIERKLLTDSAWLFVWQYSPFQAQIATL